jgi:polysaccharide biosynthesis/export protein
MKAMAIPAVGRIWGLAVLWLVLLLQWAATPALAEYRVHRGDVLEIAVAGAAGLHRRIMIDDDGKIYFPLIGELTADGLSLSQLRARIHDRLVAGHAFTDPDVTVDIAEYRPLYVTGDVAKPGAYTYRPGMTVRDAIALAGGFGRGGPLDARERYDALSVDAVRLQVRTARLRAELAGASRLDLDPLRTDGPMRPILSEFAGMEAEQLTADQNDYDNEKAHLVRLITDTQQQISALLAEQTHQQSALVQQERDAARVKALFQKSLVQIVRVEDEQRAMTNSQTQLFEVEARIAQARRDLEDYTRRLQKAAAQRKIDVLKRLEATTAELATVRIHLAALGGNAHNVGAGSEQGLWDYGPSPDVVIFRKKRGQQQRIVATEGTNLLPGDTLEVGGPTAPGAAATVSEAPLSNPAANSSETGQPAFAGGATRALEGSGASIAPALRQGMSPRDVAAAASPPAPAEAAGPASFAAAPRAQDRPPW